MISCRKDKTFPANVPMNPEENSIQLSLFKSSYFPIFHLFSVVCRYSSICERYCNLDGNVPTSFLL